MFYTLRFDVGKFPNVHIISFCVYDLFSLREDLRSYVDYLFHVDG